MGLVGLWILIGRLCGVIFRMEHAVEVKLGEPLTGEQELLSRLGAYSRSGSFYEAPPHFLNERTVAIREYRITISWHQGTFITA